MSRTSLTQGDRRIGSWPMRGYHPWSIALFKTFHQLVRFYSIKHTKDESLRELLPQKALSFMSSEEWKGICWGQVFLHCTKWEYLCQGHIRPSRLPWRFPLKPRLKRSHKYYTQTRTNVGLWCLSWVFHWLDTGRPPFLSCSMSELNLTWNFVPKTILHCFTSHLYCHACWGTGKFFNRPKCKEVILD